MGRRSKLSTPLGHTPSAAPGRPIWARPNTDAAMPDWMQVRHLPPVKHKLPAMVRMGMSRQWWLLGGTFVAVLFMWQGIMRYALGDSFLGEMAANQAATNTPVTTDSSTVLAPAASEDPVAAVAPEGSASASPVAPQVIVTSAAKPFAGITQIAFKGGVGAQPLTMFLESDMPLTHRLRMVDSNHVAVDFENAQLTASLAADLLNDKQADRLKALGAGITRIDVARVGNIQTLMLEGPRVAQHFMPTGQFLVVGSTEVARFGEPLTLAQAVTQNTAVPNKVTLAALPSAQKILDITNPVAAPQVVDVGPAPARVTNPSASGILRRVPHDAGRSVETPVTMVAMPDGRERSGNSQAVSLTQGRAAMTIDLNQMPNRPVRRLGSDIVRPSTSPPQLATRVPASMASPVLKNPGGLELNQLLAAIQQRRYDQVTQQLKQVMASKPLGEPFNQPEMQSLFHAALGELGILSQNFDSALSEYRLAYQANPRAFGARYGKLLFALGQRTRAFDVLRSVTITKDPSAQLILASLYQQRGEHQKATPLLQQVVQQQPSWYEAHYQLGLAQEMLGHPAQAKLFYSRAAKLAPSVGLVQRAVQRLSA
jgi:hypothetical protein